MDGVGGQGVKPVRAYSELALDIDGIKVRLGYPNLVFLRDMPLPRIQSI